LQLLASPYAFLAANANSISDNTGAQVLTTSGTSVGIDETPFSGDAMSVKGNVGIYENSVLDFGEGYGGQASDSGRIGYDYLSANALDIVGAGTRRRGDRDQQPTRQTLGWRRRQHDWAARSGD
jgi:hypothetical protein